MSERKYIKVSTDAMKEEINAQLNEVVSKWVREYFRPVDYSVSNTVKEIIKQNEDAIIERAIERASKKISATAIKWYREDLIKKLTDVLNETEADIDEQNEDETM